MKRICKLFTLFLPTLVWANWVQVGFLGTHAPRQVVVSFVQGSEQYAVQLRRTDDSKNPCWISEPIPISVKQSGSCRVSWQSGGESHSRDFDLPASSPFQMLLVSSDTPEPELTETVPLQLEIGLAPNPFNSQTVLTLNLPEAAHARLEVFDVLGRRVTELANRPLTAGAHRWAVDGSSCGPAARISFPTASPRGHPASAGCSFSSSSLTQPHFFIATSE